ncbi:HpcH/HpaI aldolase/citrate lyase family protein [Mycobacterium saskatchewanense]|uniref:HpcH/HpaI aldolase/citrate lyase domain-containing protein n=1 Tax=Mycobacterium saskatchewanense TaxID=220927 RepID=A0AAJ3NK47_9MYCO|nr:CoA ester lyase [Mycobacterium saskatchewanense]ORW64072.1 hypothetical protein AWC23_25785 [Mycobacterium saskatchewanense]
MALAAFRSWLYVPGDRPDRFPKAASAGADVVVCDLEDAVPSAKKADARTAVRRWLKTHRAAVRVNAADTAWHDEDIAAIAGTPGLSTLVLPKAQHRDQIARLSTRLGCRTPVVPLVETAEGIVNASDIAAGPNVATLAFGSLDYALDLGLHGRRDEDVFLFPRSVLVLACRVAGLAAPIDGVTAAITDTEAVRRDSNRAAALGFGGKQCIHPNQVGAVNTAFTPSAGAIDHAQRIVDAARAAHGSAVQLDGQMIDKPRIEQAYRVLAAAAGMAGRSQNKLSEKETAS